MPNRVCFASVDVERSVKNLSEILSILEKNAVPATLFVTGEILENNQKLLVELQEKYEIACHTFTHRFWDELSPRERGNELDNFFNIYKRVFNKAPSGFRAPSHVIDEDGLELVARKGFAYDSSIVPHYPPFKKYRGYKGRFPLVPYSALRSPKLLEIPVAGQAFGIPLAAAWVAKLPFRFYEILFSVSCPEFIALSWHSWNDLNNLDKIIKLLKNKNYQFLNGEQIQQNYKQG